MEEHSKDVQWGWGGAEGQLEGPGGGLASRPAQLTAAVTLQAGHPTFVQVNFLPRPD